MASLDPSLEVRAVTLALLCGPSSGTELGCVGIPKLQMSHEVSRARMLAASMVILLA